MKSGIHFVTFAIIISIFSLNTALASIVTDGLVSYWTFDKVHIINKTAKDVWGDKNGTIRGNPKVVSGKIGEALEFDGISDFVNLTTLGDSGRWLGTSSFEAWIKTTNQKDWMTLINTHDDECPNWGIELNGINIRNKFEINEGSLHYYFNFEGPIGCDGAGSTMGAGIFDGDWHHIVYTVDYTINEGVGGSGKIVIYIDGVPGSTSNHGFGGNRALLPFTAPVHLGARKFPGKAHGHFVGMIDEIRFYDRPLTADEVTQNFQSTEPYNVVPKGKLSTIWAALKRKL